MNIADEVFSEEHDTEAPPRVLIVDDDTQLTEAFSRLLKSAGCDVVTAPNGRAAGQLVARTRFDVVMSDVQMPDMNGVELLELLRTQDPDLSVLLISGAPDLQTALKAVELGASEYLTKPIEPERLVRSIQRASQTSKQKRDERATLEEARSHSRSKQSPVPTSGSLTGTLLSGRYRIGECIGAGGMGTVYEANRVDFADMTVAIKIVHANLSVDRDIAARFRREAETIARLDHQNIVQVYDFEAPTHGPAFLVMERLRGKALSSLIAEEAPLDAKRVVFIATQTLFALAAAHEKNIIHRDLKPENIFLVSVSGVDDVVRVLDFGIAKFADQDVELRLTQTGAVLGTPAYMAPEQARGAELDARTDLYTLGCVMYEALTGTHPFRASNYHALLVRIQESDPEPLAAFRPDVDPLLVAIVNKALAKEPNDRFQSAYEMIDALEPWLPTIAPSTRMKAAPAIQFKETDLAHHLRTTRKEGRAK